MIQGTTPTHKFNLPFSTDTIERVRITYEQDNEVVLTKEKDSLSFDGNIITVKLTQKETLAFNSHVSARIQIHVLTTGGDAVVSDIMRVPVYALLDGREI